MVDKQRYSSEDVQAILGRALERQRVRGEAELSYEELVAIGRDVGLSEAAIEAAAREHEREGEVDAELARRLRKERQGFVSHAATFLLVNAFLVGLNLVTGGPMWSFWPLFGWGFGLAFHLLAVAMPDRDKMRERARVSLERRRRDEEKRREKAARREQKERERAEREARRQALEQNAQRIKRAVEERLSEAVADLADRLEGSAPKAPPPAGRARVAPETTRARVDARDPWAEAYDEADDEASAAARRRDARF
ncbi:MAG TPA: 2TM domain-containing protein [Polyangiaceae bacterium]|nr:2TM domain-containing protein [Polyangiaceae bacterium]